MARKTAIPSLPRPIANIPLMPLNLDFWQNAMCPTALGNQNPSFQKLPRKPSSDLKGDSKSQAAVHDDQGYHVFLLK